MNTKIVPVDDILLEEVIRKLEQQAQRWRRCQRWMTVVVYVVCVLGITYNAWALTITNRQFAWINYIALAVNCLVLGGQLIDSWHRRRRP